MKYEYECWKCPKWHQTESLWGMQFAKMRIVTRVGTVTLPNVSRLYQFRSNGDLTWGGVVSTFAARCSECNHLKLHKSLWYPGNGERFCWRCM